MTGRRYANFEAEAEAEGQRIAELVAARLANKKPVARRVAASVSTPNIPEVQAALAKIKSNLTRHGAAKEFTKSSAIIRSAILAMAEAFD